MVRDYKKDILSVDTFLDNRPDMSVHSEQSIQSAIYSAASLLNGETNGNIEVVWNYNYGGERNPSDVRYRSDYELSQIVEAFIVQTQYTLNIGNDYSVGGGSYSIGNINSSFSRPIDRDILAPGVVRLLQNARVYQAQSYFSSGEPKDCNECVDYDVDCITRNIGDMRYVRKEQDVLLNGYIARINENGLVDWVRPTEIGVPSDLATQLDNIRLGISTNKQNIENNKQAIDETKLALGMVSLAVNQNIDRLDKVEPKVEKNTNDIVALNNQHASDTTAINNRFGNVEAKVTDIIERLKEGKFIHIEGDNTQWDAQHSYSIGAIVTYNGKVWLSKINNNLNNEPSSSSTQWELFSEVDIDLTKYPTKQEVLEMLDNYVLLSDFEERLKNYYTKSDIDAKLNEKANVIQLDSYVTKEAFNTSQKAQDDNIKRVEDKVNAIETGKVEGVKVATFTIEAPIVSHEVVGVDYAELDKRYGRLSTENVWTNQNTFKSAGGIEIKNGDGNNKLKVYYSNNSSEPAVFRVEYNNQIASYTLHQSGTPTLPNNLATKKYVDDNLPNISNLAKLNESNTFTQSNSFNNDLLVNNRQKLKLRKNTTDDTLNIYVGSTNDNGYVEAKLGDLVLSGNNIDVNNKKIINIAQPTNSNDAATKNYVDSNKLVLMGERFRLKDIINTKSGKAFGSAYSQVWKTNLSVDGFHGQSVVIETLGDLNNPSGQEWYRTCIITWSIGYNNKLCINLFKYYDKNPDLAYWEENIYINKITFKRGA